MLWGIFLDLSKEEDKVMMEEMMKTIGDVAKVQEIIQQSDGKIDMKDIMEKMKEPKPTPTFGGGIEGI